MTKKETRQLREMSDKGLTEVLTEARKELRKRQMLSHGGLQVGRIKETRKLIARVLTIQKERKMKDAKM